MKKVLIIFLSLVLLLCSCEKKEYNLIELTGDELMNHLSKDDCSIVIAIYSESYDNSDNFLNDLKSVAKRTKENIYYIDINHLDMMSGLILTDALNTQVDSLKYIVFQKGKLIIDEEYTDYNKMYSSLNGKKYEDVELILHEDKVAQLEEAKKLYDDGYISKSYDACLRVWSLDEAKKMVKNSNLFKLVNQWEYKNIVSKDKINYISMIFLSIDNAVFYIDETVKTDGFTYPEIKDYSSYFYRMRDGKLCISEKNDGDCKEEFEILSVNDEKLRLKKNNKEYEFYVMKEVG